MYILREKKNVWLGETQSKEVGFFTAENVEEVPVSELTEGARTKCVAIKINLSSYQFNVWSFFEFKTKISYRVFFFGVTKQFLVFQTSPVGVDLFFF